MGAREDVGSGYLFAVLNTRFPSTLKRLVAIELAKHTDGSGWCFPSYTTLAEYACLERGRVREQIEALVKMRLMVKVPGGPKRSNRYRFREVVKEKGEQW